MNYDFIKSECIISHEIFEILRDTFDWNIIRNKHDIDYQWWRKENCMTSKIIRKNDDSGYRHIISGSIPKHINCLSGNGPISHNEIDHSAIVKAIKSLFDMYLIDPENSSLQNLEFNIDLRTDEAPRKIIDEMIYLYKHKEATINTTYENGGKGIYFKMGKMLIKIYDKGKEAQLDYNLLRIEIRYMANEPLSKIGIKSVGDLFNPNSKISLANELYKVVNTLQIIDNPDTAKMSSSEMKIFDNFTNRKKYLSLKKVIKSRATLSRRNQEFQRLVKDKKLTKTKDSFLEEILRQKTEFETKRNRGNESLIETKRTIHIDSNCSTISKYQQLSLFPL